MDLDRLEELAKDATPGPWWLDEEGAICTSGKETPLDLRPIVFDAAYENVLDATYIAAVDPQTVLQLIAEVREARQRSSTAVPVEQVSGEVITEEGYRAGDEALLDLMDGEP